MLSKETARCFSPPSDIAPASLSPIQPITQSVHIPGSVTGHVGGGGAPTTVESVASLVTQSSRPIYVSGSGLCSLRGDIPAAHRRYLTFNTSLR